MLELLRRDLGDCVAVVIVSERDDGDVRPDRVPDELLIARQMSMTSSRWVMLDEVHGVDVHRSDGRMPSSAIAAVGDVLVGDRFAPPVAVWAADCAPVMLFDERGVPVACHAGWRGLAAGVIDVSVGAVPSPVVAVLGPCIHPCCYEFGERELALVAAGVGVPVETIAGTTSVNTLALDVPAAVTAAFDLHGVEVVAIDACTGCDERWYSHRRGDSGRHALVGWSEEPS
ncbi:MAG: laccase domain-containing protein [Acidimicrobiales bacterium]|nr:MAG: laccase domain-containing protein [Acidimicrobiales bacterium]